MRQIETMWSSRDAKGKGGKEGEQSAALDGTADCAGQKGKGGREGGKTERKKQNKREELFFLLSVVFLRKDDKVTKGGV